MSSDRDRLQSLVDALPDSDVQVAISFLAELGEQGIIDAETAAKLDQALTEPGADVPLEEVRRRLGKWQSSSASIRQFSSVRSALTTAANPTERTPLARG
ncbi:MAG: hypothetical protein HY820_02455 [Acidobacteria bacterium]|nr:hypothetical protein [Acidobacteriota bacterium]